METKVVLTGDEGPLKRAVDSARSTLNRFGEEAGQPFAKLRDALGNVGNLVAALGGMRIIGLADDAALIQARLRDVAGGIQAAAQAQGQLFAASQRLQVSYGDLAGSFSKMLPAVKEMGGGANEAVRLAEILAMTARLAGASSGEAAAGMLQFGQAIQRGALDGDELKSIMENNGTLARALAEGLGVTVGELRTLGEQGKLTSDKVAQALLGQYDQIQSRSAELPATVGGAWQQVTNSFQQFVAAANEGSGVFSGLSSILSAMSKLIDSVRVSFAGVGTESDKLNKNNSIKEWGQTVGAMFAWVVDLGRAVWESLQLVGKQIGALAAAAVAAARGDLSEAKNIMSAYEQDFVASWERIKNLTTGGKGSTLFAYATDAGTEAPATSGGARLKSNAPAGKAKKPEGEDPARMASMEVGLQAQKTYLIESGKLLDSMKEYELAYWSEILSTASLTEKEKVEVSKKMAALRLEIAREQAKEAKTLDQQSVEDYKELELLRLEGQRIATENLLANDQITKAQALQREIEFEEQRLAIMQEYLRRRQDLLPENDLAGRQKLSGEMTAEGQRSDNTKARLGGKLEKEQGGLDIEGTFNSMGSAAANGFGRLLTSAQNWRQSMAGIFESVKAAFIKSVITDTIQAQLAAWGKQLAMKIGFIAQEKAVEQTATTATIAIKGTETTAVTGMNAVQAATEAAKSQAGIPVIGPGLALAAMAAIFAAVSAMGGKMKSARNGFDIPAGLNPVTQLHEEEMVLPKEQANVIRDMAAGGGGGSGGQVIYNDHSGRLTDAEIRRKAGVIADELSKVTRNGWRPKST